MALESRGDFPDAVEGMVEMMRLRRMMATVLGGGASAPTFAQILRDTYGASEIYPLADIASGTTIPAFVNAAHNGSIGGAWDLQNGAGPVTGELSPYLDGTADFGNIANLAADFNGAVGNAFIYGLVTAAGDWSDGVLRELFNHKVNNNNWIRIYKHGTLGLYVYAAIGGVAKQVNLGIPAAQTSWFMAGLSWQDSANGNAVKAILNGAQVGSTQTGFGAWAGTPVIDALGSAAGTSASAPWKGWLAYHTLKFGSVWTPTQFGEIHTNP